MCAKKCVHHTYAILLNTGVYILQNTVLYTIIKLSMAKKMKKGRGTGRKLHKNGLECLKSATNAGKKIKSGEGGEMIEMHNICIPLYEYVQHTC